MGTYLLLYSKERGMRENLEAMVISLFKTEVVDGIKAENRVIWNKRKGQSSVRCQYK